MRSYKNVISYVFLVAANVSLCCLDVLKTYFLVLRLDGPQRNESKPLLNVVSIVVNWYRKVEKNLTFFGTANS